MIDRYSCERSNSTKEFCSKRLIYFLLAALLSFCAASAEPTAHPPDGGIRHDGSQNGSRKDSKDLSKESGDQKRPAPISSEAAEAQSFQYPKCSDEMHEYFMDRSFLLIAAPLISSLILFALLQAGLLPWLKARLQKFPSFAAQLFSMATSIYVIAYLIKLPLLIYSSYYLEHKFGLSHQTLFHWLTDQFNAFCLSSMVILPVCACFFLQRKFPRGWHFPVWVMLSSLIALMVFLEPLLVDPVFNKFTPLNECPLKTDIIALCHKAGLATPTLLVADTSKQTIKLNAYVTGISASKRIVLFDNLIKTVPEDQILAVLAHELGHYQLKHVLKGLILAIVILYPAVLLYEKSIDKMIKRLPPKWGIESSSDPALIALWCLVLWILPLFISPAESSVSRFFESEADAYGIRLTGNPLAAARLFTTLSTVNMSNPDPPAFFEFWFYSHPSLKHRIDYALNCVRKTKQEGNS